MLARLQRDWIYLTCAQSGGLAMRWDEFLEHPVMIRYGFLHETEALIRRINDWNEAANEDVEKGG